MLENKEIKEILKIKGMVRGVVFQSDAQYVLKKEGEAGLKKLEAAIAKTGQLIRYKEVKAVSWYPLSWRVLSLLFIQDTFSWDKQEMFKMGLTAPKFSFLVRTLLKYFISVKKTFKESEKYWEEHYSTGTLETFKFDLKNKYLILRLKNFKIHPLLCSYLRGYFQTITAFVIKASKMTSEETKCMFRGDPYHEFVIKW